MQAADHRPDDPLLSLRLQPHRSLTVAQQRVLLVILFGCGAVTSLPFVLMGAWPVAGFMGLDVLGLLIAFGASERAAKAYEDLRLTMVELLVAKVGPRGQRAEWRFNPAWVRLRRDEHEEFGLLRLDVVSRGRALEIGGFLGPVQKAVLAERLGAALADARRGYRQS